MNFCSQLVITQQWNLFRILHSEESWKDSIAVLLLVVNKNSQLVVTPCATHPPCHKPALRAHLSRVCTCPRAAPTRTWAILPRRLHRHRLHRHRASRSTTAQSHGTQPVRTASREAEISLPSTPRRSKERPSRSLVGSRMDWAQ